MCLCLMYPVIMSVPMHAMPVTMRSPWNVSMVVAMSVLLVEAPLVMVAMSMLLVVAAHVRMVMVILEKTHKISLCIHK